MQYKVKAYTFEVTHTTYVVYKSKQGKESLLVSYYLPWGEATKQWLSFRSESFCQWWRDRTKRPYPKTLYEAANMCNKGLLKRTASVTVTRDGERWWSVVGTVVGEYDKQFYDFMRDAKELFGDLEVIRVKA